MRIGRHGSGLLQATAAVLAALALGHGTALAQEAESAPSAPVRIAFVVANVNDAFYQKAAEGARLEAERLGVELIHQGPNEFSAAAEITVLDTLLALEPDALAIAPADPTALVAPMQAWADAGIPIVTYDGGLADPPFPLVSRILSANYEGGQMAADEMARLTGSAGEIAIIDLNTANKVLTDRLDGFRDRIAEAYPEMSVVDVQLTGLDFPKAQTIAQTFVNKYPNLAGVFATYSFATEYGAIGLMSVGAQDRVRMVGFEAGPKEIELIEQGVLDATIAQQPALEGQMAVQQAYYAVTGQTDKIVPELLLSDVVINADNVANMTEYYYAVE